MPLVWYGIVRFVMGVLRIVNMHRDRHLRLDLAMPSPESDKAAGVSGVLEIS